MARNGSGTYVLPSGNPVVTGTTISSTDFNGTMTDIATALSGSISADGQTPITANIPFGSNRITGLAPAGALTDATNSNDVQSSRLTYLTGVAGGNTITGSVPYLTAYAAGQQFSFVAASANTGATTLNINGLGAKAITKNGATALAGGEIISGQSVAVRYDGTQFQLIGAPRLTVGTSVASTSGATIDFTGIPSWANRITLLLRAVSTSGSSSIIAQIGNGAVVTTGYATLYTNLVNGSSPAQLNVTSGFPVAAGVAAANTVSGHIVFEQIAANVWVATSQAVAANGTSSLTIASGDIALGGTLDRIRLTTVNGTDTFDAGIVNIYYE